MEYARIKLEKLKALRASWSDDDLMEIIAHSITINRIDSGPINFKNWLTVAQSQDKEYTQINKSLENNDDLKKKV